MDLAQIHTTKILVRLFSVLLLLYTYMKLLCSNTQIEIEQVLLFNCHLKKYLFSSVQLKAYHLNVICQMNMDKLEVSNFHRMLLTPIWLIFIYLHYKCCVLVCVHINRNVIPTIFGWSMYNCVIWIGNSIVVSFSTSQELSITLIQKLN